MDPKTENAFQLYQAALEAQRRAEGRVVAAVELFLAGKLLYAELASESARAKTARAEAEGAERAYRHPAA